MIFYSYLSALVFLTALTVFTVTFFTDNNKIKLLIVTIAIIASLISWCGNTKTVMLINGLINMLSISSLCLLLIYIFDNLTKSNNLSYRYSLYAFAPIVIFFYAFSLFAHTRFYPFTYGFSPLMLTMIVSIYALTLLAISRKFILFNCIICLVLLTYHTNILGHNLWNYLLDPILIILILVGFGLSFCHPKKSRSR